MNSDTEENNRNNRNNRYLPQEYDESYEINLDEIDSPSDDLDSDDENDNKRRKLE